MASFTRSFITSCKASFSQVTDPTALQNADRLCACSADKASAGLSVAEVQTAALNNDFDAIKTKVKSMTAACLTSRQ